MEIRTNHEIRKIQNEIWNCVNLGLIPEVKALQLSKEFQQFKVSE